MLLGYVWWVLREVRKCWPSGGWCLGSPSLLRQWTGDAMVLLCGSTSVTDVQSATYALSWCPSRSLLSVGCWIAPGTDDCGHRRSRRSSRRWHTRTRSSWWPRCGRQPRRTPSLRSMQWLPTSDLRFALWPQRSSVACVITAGSPPTCGGARHTLLLLPMLSLQLTAGTLDS